MTSGTWPSPLFLHCRQHWSALWSRGLSPFLMPHPIPSSIFSDQLLQPGHPFCLSTATSVLSCASNTFSGATLLLLYHYCHFDNIVLFFPILTFSLIPRIIYEYHFILVPVPVRQKETDLSLPPVPGTELL